ncbi:FMN-binding protein [Pseudarthrobacter albicanus]|uniref:FMN-binding protein n=1 Tax=Pseudarthrobacter albicanus TaxID=2823873 RepID=UPI001BAA7A70|nr:FMN-binding protein [Pseudarthrobacter albicanus]
MRARAAVSAALASAGILLAGWQAGVRVEDTGSGAVGTLSGTDGTAGSRTTGSGTTGSAAKAAGTYAGAVVQTRFGAVQVQITVKAGAITDVTALQLTDAERKSIQISNRAAPLLRAEVLKAQSSKVQTISGATVTSAAYLTSLQAALDAANL